MPFQIIRQDITKIEADAIVNTANPDVAIGSGVDAAIYNAAGRDELLKAREEIGILAPGEVGITPAFQMDAKYIIHASGPWWEGGTNHEAETLRNCYDKALKLAYEHKCESIAFPVLATGTYGFPKELGVQIAVDAFTDFLEEHEMDITLAVFGNEAVSISGKIVDEVKSFIDADYEEDALSKEYSFQGYRMGSLYDRSSCEADPEEISTDTGAMLFSQAAMATPVEEEAAPKTESLEDALKEIYTDSFEKHLQQLINKKGLKNSQVYSAANISKQYFSKLLKGQVTPSKAKLLALAVGLRLNLDETVDFLRIAGYALSPISQTDKVVEYFIEHEDYNVMKIDIVLFDYGLDPLSNQ